MKSEKALLIGLGIAMVGIFLASNPSCRRGCRSVAEHLIEHGVADFLASLIG